MAIIEAAIFKIDKVTFNPELNLSFIGYQLRKKRVEDYKRDLKLFCKAFHQQLSPLIVGKYPEEARCGILVSTRNKFDNQVYLPIATYDPRSPEYDSSAEYTDINFTGSLIHKTMTLYTDKIKAKGMLFKYLVYKNKPESIEIPPDDQEYLEHYIKFLFNDDLHKKSHRDFLGIAFYTIKQVKKKQHLEFIGAINFDHAQELGLPTIKSTVENYRVEALIYLLVTYLARIGNNYQLFKDIQHQKNNIDNLLLPPNT